MEQRERHSAPLGLGGARTADTGTATEAVMRRWFRKKVSQPAQQTGGRFKRLPARVDPRSLRTSHQAKPPRHPESGYDTDITRYGDPFDG